MLPDNWVNAFKEPGLFRALFNTVWLWVLSAAVAFPIAVSISWLLARTKIPWSHGLEFLFWVGYVTPGGLVAWIMLFDPSIGLANVGLRALPFVDQGPFNIFSVQGIIFVNIIGSGISLKYSFVARNRSVQVRNPRLHRFARRLGGVAPEGSWKRWISRIYRRTFTTTRESIPSEDVRVLAELRKHFEPLNERLAAAVNLDLSAWQTEGEAAHPR